MGTVCSKTLGKSALLLTGIHSFSDVAQARPETSFDYAGPMPPAADPASADRGQLPARRRRPRNRRTLIIRAAAHAFSERGYHGVSMEEIAAEVGISAPALYRHFPGKYSLFLETALQLVQELLDATEDSALPKPRHPGERLEQLLDAVIAVTQANRRTGSIYRHEGRYLTPADHALLWSRFDELTLRVLKPLREVHPELDPAAARFRAVGAFGMVGSITAHHTALSPGKTAALLHASALSVLDFPPVAGESGIPAHTVRTPGSGIGASAQHGVQPGTRRELLLAQAVGLFYRRGYREVTIEEIGAAAGITASAVYRHFRGKSALLLQACQLAAHRLDAATREALAAGSGPRDSLEALIHAYVLHTFAHHELMSVYFADVLNLSVEEQSQLRRLQRQHIGIWVDLVAAQVPGLGTPEVRFLVHGALNMVADLGRFTRFDQSPPNLERTTKVILHALGAACAR